MPAKKKTPEEGSPKSRWALIPFLTLILGGLGLWATGPTLYESDVAVTGDHFTVKVTNKGRTAQIGNIWCGAGAFLNPGTAKLSKLVTASSDIFRRSIMAPDQQEIVDMLVPIAVTPEAAARLNNPLFLRLNSSTNWAVACKLPYWDRLDKWKLLEEDLEFCYEVQPRGTGTERQATMCTRDELSKAIQELGGPK